MPTEPRPPADKPIRKIPEEETADFLAGVNAQEPENAFLRDGHRKKGERESTKNPPEEEVNDFLAEMNLEPMLPFEFHKLSETQKLKVIRDLKRRVVDIVKADAQTQYSEAIKERVKKDKGILKVVGVLADSIKKESEIKKTEYKVFEEIRTTDEGKKLIVEDLKLLVGKAGRQDVGMGTFKGEAYPFVYYDPGGLDTVRYTPEEIKVFSYFNRFANDFSQIPYEWGQERSGKHKREYEKAKAEYEKARNAVLEIKTKKENPYQKGKAMLDMLEVDNALQMEQLLNTHPEFEKALNDLTEGKSGIGIIEGAKNLLKKVIGEKGANRQLFAGGFGLRMAARGAALASGATFLTALAAPVTGALIGGLRGRLRAKDTLETRQREARRGKEDESKEKVVMTDATHMSEKLEKLDSEVNNLYSKGNIRAGDKKLALLLARIEHTQGKIEKGQVNFGDTKSSLTNQFNLVNSLNKALSVTVMMDTSFKNTPEKERIDKWLAKVGGMISEKTSEAQKDFIKKQTIRGIKMGAGFATAGYVTRWFGESMGWWGTQEVETARTDTSEGFIKRTEDWISKIFGQKEAETPTPTVPKIPGADTPEVAPATPSAEAAVPPVENVAPVAPSPESLKTTPFDQKTLPGATQLTEPPTSPEIVESALLNPDAVIHKGEGIEHAFIRQIERPELAKQFGFTGDVSDTKALHAFAQRQAHLLAIKEGYVSSDGQEIRVAGADKMAYEINMDSGYPVIEEKTISGEIIETHQEGDPFEKITEDYEYKHGGNRGIAQGDATPPRTSVVEGAESTPRDAAEVITPPPRPTVEEVRARVLENMPETPSGKNVIYDSRTGSNIPANNDEVVNRIMNTPAGRNVIYNSRTGPNNYGNQAYFAGRRVEYFQNLSESDNLILQTHPEFGTNPFGLTGEELIEVYKESRRNIDILFGDQVDHWNILKNQRADMFIKNTDLAKGDTNGLSYGYLAKYLQKLQEVTGLEPKGSLFGLRNAETAERYITRALQKAEALGKTEIIEASVKNMRE